MRARIVAALSAVALTTALAAPAVAAPPPVAGHAWIAEDGTAVAVDVEGRRVRARGCDLDTGWVADPRMRTTSTATGAVETGAGTLSYRLPLRGAAGGRATLDGVEVRSEVVTPVPYAPRGRARGADALASELEGILAASETNGGSVTVRDLSGPGTGEQFSVGGQEQYKAASLIKLQVLVELLRQVDCGLRDLAEQVWVTQEDLVGGAGTLRLEEGFPKYVGLDRLARLMIVVSDNSATNLVVEQIGGGDRVNDLNEMLGLRQTRYLGRLLNPEWSWNLTSADDSAATLAVIWGSPLLGGSGEALALDFLRGQQVATKFKAALPPGTPLAHKTGELGDVSHDVGFILVPGREISVSVLTDGPRTPTGNELVQELVRAVYDDLVAP